MLHLVADGSRSAQNLAKRVAAIADAGVPAHDLYQNMFSYRAFCRALRTSSATAHSSSSFHKHLGKHLSQKTLCCKRTNHSRTSAHAVEQPGMCLGQVKGLHEGQRSQRVEQATLAHEICQCCELARHTRPHVCDAIWCHREVLATDFVGLGHDEIVWSEVCLGVWRADKEDAAKSVLAVTSRAEKKHAILASSKTEAAFNCQSSAGGRRHGG